MSEESIGGLRQGGVGERMERERRMGRRMRCLEMKLWSARTARRIPLVQEHSAREEEVKEERDEKGESGGE